MNSFEGNINELQLVELTSADIHAIVSIRAQIDGVEVITRLNTEAEGYIKGKNKKVFLSKIGEKVNGYVEVKLEESELPSGSPNIEEIDGLAHLARIGVSEEFRGKGVGKSLLKKAEEWAMENGKS